MGVIEFRHGWAVPSYEEQANAQGFTINKENREKFEKIGDNILALHMYGILTEKETDKALQRFQKMLVKELKPMKGE